MKLIGVKSARVTVVCLGLVFLLALAPRALALSNGQAASLVLGQSTFIANIGAATPTEENIPNGVAFDSGGNLWVADSNNNRVLEYKAPFSTHEAATLVLGQTSLTDNAAAATRTGLAAPEGLAFDSGGNIWVADNGNSRVLEYGGATVTTTTSTAPEFPAVAVPITLIAVLAVVLALAPGRRFRQP